MYNKIVNPISGRKVNVNSKLGREIIKNYFSQLAGAPPHKEADHPEGGPIEEADHPTALAYAQNILETYRTSFVES